MILHLRPLADVGVDVHCTSASTSAFLADVFRPWQPRAAVDVESPIVVTGPDPEGRYEVTGPLGPWCGEDRDRLLVELQMQIDDVVVRRTRLFPIHAGAVAVGGRVLLLPGVSRTGKSALVAALAAAGATYFSDEYALLDGDGRVHPYARPLLLRERDRGSDVRRAVPPAMLTTSIGTTPLPVQTIVALCYSADATLRLKQVSTSEGALLLLENTPRVVGDHPGPVTPALRALRRATVYRGVRGDVETAVPALLALLK